METSAIIALGLSAAAGLLSSLILFVLKTQNTDLLTYRTEQTARHNENRRLLEAINGRVRATETQAAADTTALAAHTVFEQEVRRIAEARTDQLRHDVNELRSDMRLVLAARSSGS